MANMFNEDGTYNKTEWKAGDKITAVKLNKIESSLEAINNNDISRHVEADSRLDILEERMVNTPDNKQMDALEDMVKDNKDAADLAVYSINQKIESLESVNADSRLDSLEGVNAGSRLDSLEGVNAGSRLEVLEEYTDVMKNYITYEEFGAIGDGVYDDGIAIKAAHEYANAHDLKVIATGKTYHIKETVDISIKTDTDFNGATFIIDDTLNVDKKRGVFVVNSKYSPITLTPNIEVGKQTRNISSLAGYGVCLVEVMNRNKLQFIRYGENGNSGAEQRDYFIIDNDGNIMSDVIWDFDTITSVVLYPIDEKPLVISNGIFITKPNKGALESWYYERGIIVYRSNTILQNIKHELIDESPGSPYAGFIHAIKCAHVVIRDSVVQSRKTYYKESNGVALGSYDIRFDGCVEIYLYNVVDVGFHNDRWGVFTMNYAKDVYIEKCKLTRVDAHEGVHNLKIRDCTLGHQGIRLVGGGLCEIENVDVVDSYSLITLRDDYGSSWDGDIYVRNVKYITTSSTSMPKLIDFKNVGSHDFGYECRAPRRLVFENILIDDTPTLSVSGTTYKHMYCIYNDDSRVGALADRVYKYKFSEYIKLKNIKTVTGTGLKIFYKPPFNLYMDNEHKFEVVEKLDETNKLLNIRQNMNVLIDDVELTGYLGSGGYYGTSSIFSSMPAIDDMQAVIDEDPHIAIPMITIRNCKNVFAAVNDTPVLLFFDNCEIRVLTGKVNSTMMKGAATNCIFEPQTINGGAVLNPNWYDFSFINCHFDRPINNGAKVTDINTIATIFTFLTKFKLIGNAYFQSKVKMVNCTIFDFDFKEFEPLIDYCDFKFGNHCFEYHLCSRGYDGEKPNISKCPIPVGFIYWVTSSGTFKIWNGESWMTLTTAP